ncbi:MAG: GNAT family N-acetyltransferase [Bacteroidota bacterium]|jgi:GNAT superfamily N-acetyltransferase
MNFQIRNYRAEDELAVVALWNRCLPKDEIFLNTFRRKIILDPNFDMQGCFVAVARKQVIGFILSIRRRYPYYDLGLEPGKGWITVFFVDPLWRRQSVATELLEHAERFLSGHAVTEVYISDYTPNYFIPGVDVDANAEAHEFLKARGYKKVQSVYGMGRSLVDFTIPAEMDEVTQKLNQAGFSVTVFRPAHTLKLLEFLRKNYPGDLFRVALDRLTEEPECDEILVALKDDQVVGFSHFLNERFGPFGIDPEFTGRGLGPLLYYQTVLQMRKKGKHNLWLAWTTGKAKDFYHKVDLKVHRRHVIMKKNL